ncbi:hypothetical protein BU25DRAFT_445484 [Macroventuria anomochaeta]|uniref:Uncharacterized protein n=1 Tax=Macroventuria anomochaeta TaxID=301207 RepID=A0ACB6SDR4_9PLEO|nr:uncharacterized protein BU25DRAFT_445484 [Macroventuria anomochaeta]KAF2632445.1 hypothetical protein BU25DRAFT_445484 [Macroventuria anomochaeta]
MPSLKKFIHSKELSNPYVNRYHPGHTSTRTPNPAVSSSYYPTYPQPAAHFPTITKHLPKDPATFSRRPSPLRQFDSSAARSGQGVSHTGCGNPQPAPSPLPASALHGHEQPNGRQQPLQSYQAANTTGGDAAMGIRVPQVPQGRVDHAGSFVEDEMERETRPTQLEGRVYATDEQRMVIRYDAIVHEEWREREEEERAAAARAASA